MAKIRYLVGDVDRSLDFYTQHLGFKLEHHAGPALPDGRQQQPGGWNRLLLDVEDLPSRFAKMKQAGLHFRSDIVTGPGGQQVQLEDPDGNPIELFESASKP